MALPGRCTECGSSLSGKQKYTCGDKCRSARSRRLKAQKRDAGSTPWMSPEATELAQQIGSAAGDVAHEVLKEELRPVAREAITEDVLRAIQRMVALTPEAVAAIAEDLKSSDRILRQRAYTLLTKYTIGHQALIRPEESTSGQMIVNFNLPRPGDEVASEGAAVDLVSEELRVCDMCEEEKPITQFVAGSDRCQSCYDKQREFAQSLLDRTAH